jgi:hypothetical protein
LGAHAHAAFSIPVIGAAKSRFRTATHAVPVVPTHCAAPIPSRGQIRPRSARPTDHPVNHADARNAAK